MTMYTGKRIALLLALALALLPAAACSDDGSTDPVDVESLRPLIGTWRAESLVQTSKADPETSIDLIAEGATFTFRVTEQGRYEANLEFFGNPFPATGRITVNGSSLTLDPDNSDDVEAAEWRVEGNTLFLSGSSTFDFNLDGEAIPTDLEIRLTRV